MAACLPVAYLCFSQGQVAASFASSGFLGLTSCCSSGDCYTLLRGSSCAVCFLCLSAVILAWLVFFAAVLIIVASMLRASSCAVCFPCLSAAFWQGWSARLSRRLQFTAYLLAYLLRSFCLQDQVLLVRFWHLLVAAFSLLLHIACYGTLACLQGFV